jgi:hypothetical protein
LVDPARKAMLTVCTTFVALTIVTTMVELVVVPGRTMS